MFRAWLCTILCWAFPGYADDFIIPQDEKPPFNLLNSADCDSTRIAIIDMLFVKESHLSGIGGKTSSWIAATNNYFKNSKIYLRVRKAGLVDHDFRASTLRSKLTELHDDPDLRQIRNQYRADFVQGVVEGKGAMGIGYVSTRAQYAFSVVRPNAGPVTSAHELGHNLGLGHSVLQGSRGNPYFWGRGHGVRDKFATIMAYAHLYPAPRIHKFSNPLVRCNGYRCGVGGEHNRSANSARAINCVRFHVSRHR